MLITLTKHETDQHGTDKHRTTLTRWSTDVIINHSSEITGCQSTSAARKLSTKAANDSHISSGGFRPGRLSSPGLYLPVFTAFSVSTRDYPQCTKCELYLKFSTIPIRWPLLLGQLLHRPR